jgi:hypothetical protein
VTRPQRLAAILPLVLLGCGDGDNSAIRVFHASVAPGEAISEAVVRAERSQKEDAEVVIEGKGCPRDTLRLGRTYGNPYIRVIHESAKPEDAVAPGHSETSYAKRDEFARAVKERLPAFFSCEAFVFTFSRNQFWYTTDSFSVAIDADGRITEVSSVKKDSLRE